MDNCEDPVSVAAELQQDPSSRQFSYIPFNNPPARMEPDLEVYGEQVQPQHFFHPFLDAELLDVFPNGDLINFELDTSPMSLNFLDGWAPGMNTNFSAL